MDVSTEAEDALHQQQLLFAKQLQAEDARLYAKEQPLEDAEFFHSLAREFFESFTGSSAPGEEAASREIQEHYELAKSNQQQSKEHDCGNILDGFKRRKVSPSPMFIQQDEAGRDEESDPPNDSPGSKRRRGEASEDYPKNSRPVPMTETVKQFLKRLIDDAPEGKRQAAVQDSERVLRAIKQFREGSINYLGDGLWNVEGIITPIKTHQLIHAGWMNEQETSTRGPKGGILADKMGLGKTLCTLTSMVHRKSSVGSRGSRTSLVVVPKPLKDQWVNEARKHTAQPTSDDMLGINHILPYNPEPSSDTQMLLYKSTDLVVVTYTELSSAFKNVRYPSKMEDEAEKELYFNETIRPTLPAIFRFKFRAIYLDEGHLIRNVKTLWAMACQKLLSRFRWILTGTPMTNDPTDLYSVLTFIRHPSVLELTFKEFKACYKGGGKTKKDTKAVRKGKGGKNAKIAKKAKGDKNDKKEIDVEWVGTLLHESMRSWRYEDELFGHHLTEIPDPTIVDQSLELSVPERVIYSVVGKRLQVLAKGKSDDDDDDADAQKLAETHKFLTTSIKVLRQMTGHVLLIRPDIFRYLTDEDMTAIDNGIHRPETSTGQNFAESMETSLDPHANDYFVALRELQRGNTCVVCEQRAEDPRWAACNHAYCYSCLDSEMHLAAEQEQQAQCRLCKLPVGQCTDEAEHEKAQKPRWLNKDGKVIPSAKSSAVVTQLKSWKDPLTGDAAAKVLVFTSFKDSLKLLKATFEEQQWNFTTLTSDLSTTERNENVSKFKTDPRVSIMLATSGVGGTGLNLMNAK